MTDPIRQAYQGYTKKVQPVIINDKLPGAVILIASILLCGVILFLCVGTAGADIVDTGRLADAIYMAEGGSHTRHLYGILKKYKKTTPRQACINTIKSALRRYENSDKSVDFIVFLSRTYCPIGASNDPTGLNVNWVKNVYYFYNRGR
jgi:hypothetical protein